MRLAVRRLAGQHGEGGAVVADQAVAGDPGVVDGHRAARSGVGGQGPVQGHGVVRVDPRGERGSARTAAGSYDRHMNGPPARDQKLAPSQLTGCPAAMIRVEFLRMGGGSPLAASLRGLDYPAPGSSRWLGSLTDK